jgi:hypothetical protein
MITSLYARNDHPGILITCPHCKMAVRHDSDDVGDAIKEGRGIECVACGNLFRVHVEVASNDIDNFLNYCIDYFGKEKQEIVAIEEMAELTQQLSKFLIGHPNRDRDKVVEEYVDVLLMLNQLRIIFCITDQEVETARSFKLSRLKKFIEERVTR